MPPVAYTAPAPYPYAGGARPDPSAIGPSWAAPAVPAPHHRPRHHAPAPAAAHAAGRAHHHVAPRGPSLGRRVVSWLFSFFSVLVLLAGAAFVVIAIASRQGLVDEEDLPVVLPDQPVAIPAVTPMTQKPDKVAEGAWTSGTCGDFSKERDLPAYQAGRNSGSAQALKGKTIGLVIKLHAPALAWTKSTELSVDRASLMAQRFYLTQAKKRGVPLQFDVVPWELKTAYALPSLALDANQRLPSDTMDAIRDGSRAAIEGALGAKLDRVISTLRKDGYENVAIFVFLPVKTSARSFAVPSYRSAPKDYPEAAYLFVPQNDFGHFAVTMAHEGMHLFGADDLYRVKNVDKRDNDDVMGEYCTGFLKAQVGDATAFAVGWLNAPPPRPYPFDVK